jgi:hypothetical protein
MTSARENLYLHNCGKRSEMNDKSGSSHPEGSGKPVDDFISYCEGDIEPTLNKKIHTLIDCDTDYIVYLDDEFFVEYSWTEAYGGTPEGFGDIASKVAHLEGLSTLYLSPEQLPSFRRILGEAMARIVGDKDSEKAKATLEIAISFLTERSSERARIWYLQASSAVAGTFLLLAAILWLFRNAFIVYFSQDTLEVSVGTLAGALGSFMSIWMRPEKVRMDAGAGKSVHLWEGAAKIAMGVACAFGVALAFKAEIIVPFAKASPRPFALLLVLCIAAGFTERLFMNLIGHFHDPNLKRTKGK